VLAVPPGHAGGCEFEPCHLRHSLQQSKEKFTRAGWITKSTRFAFFLALGRRYWALTKYALTRICSAVYMKAMESVFEIIAEPSRRAILSLLVSAQQSVGQIERQLRMPQPSVSKHLRVLREAGFVESTVDAQRRLYRLKPEPLQEVEAWLAPFRRFWSAHLDALEHHLDRMDQSCNRATRTKRKTRRSRGGPICDRDKGESK